MRVCVGGFTFRRLGVGLGSGSGNFGVGSASPPWNLRATASSIPRNRQISTVCASVGLEESLSA